MLTTNKNENGDRTFYRQLIAKWVKSGLGDRLATAHGVDAILI